MFVPLLSSSLRWAISRLAAGETICLSRYQSVEAAMSTSASIEGAVTKRRHLRLASVDCDCLTDDAAHLIAHTWIPQLY